MLDYADIREAIYDQLCTNVTGIHDSSSPPVCKVFWGWTAPADTEKPFIVLTITGTLPSLNTPLGMFIQIDVDVFGGEGNILDIDPVADEVISALHNQSFTTPTGKVIRPEFRRDTRVDSWSEEFRANVIHMRFMIPTDLWT